MTLDGSVTIRYPAPTRTSLQPTDSQRRSCGRLRWHCVQSKPGQAFQAELALAEQGWRTYHPLHLHRIAGRAPKIVPLFNNYMFTLFDPQADQWPMICRCFGVQALLGTPGHPAPVPNGVVEELQRRTSDRRIVDDPLAEGAWRRMPPGAAVSVVDGPLSGLAGICRLSAPERCSVLLSLFGRECVMEIPTRALEVA